LPGALDLRYPDLRAGLALVPDVFFDIDLLRVDFKVELDFLELTLAVRRLFFDEFRAFARVSDGFL